MKKKTKKRFKQKIRKQKQKKEKISKPRKKSRHYKIRKKIKKPKKQRKIKPKSKIKKFRKVSKRKISKKPKIKIRPKVSLKRKQLKKLSFRRVINFVLQPILKAYDDFREKRKNKKLRKIALEKKERERQIKEEKRLRYEAKQQELRDEIKFAKERSQDLKNFIRQEQAILRREESEKRRHFLEEIKLEKKIESFRKRELQEIKNLEKLALQEEREDYRSVQARIEQIKAKYEKIRTQKIIERVQSFGLKVSESDTREDLLQKEKEYSEQRQKIEFILESFYRSANSLIFQLNKRYIPKHKSILRVIDRRYEENLFYLRYDDTPSEEDWLILVYLEDINPEKETIILEDKTNPDRHVTKSFRTKDIFEYSDYLVDQMTQHIDRERQKKAS